MLWKDFVEATDCDCDVCPIKKNGLCNGTGVACYGGEPVYAPCSEFEDNLDVDKYIEEELGRIRKYNEQREKLAKEKQAKKEKADKTAKIRKEADMYCSVEIAKIKKLKKQIKAMQDAYDAIKIRASAYNSVNKMFGYSEQYAEKMPEIESKINAMNTELEELQKTYKAKRKAFLASRKEKK